MWVVRNGESPKFNTGETTIWQSKDGAPDRNSAVASVNPIAKSVDGTNYAAAFSFTDRTGRNRTIDVAGIGTFNHAGDDSQAGRADVCTGAGCAGALAKSAFVLAFMGSQHATPKDMTDATRSLLELGDRYHNNSMATLYQLYQATTADAQPMSYVDFVVSMSSNSHELARLLPSHERNAPRPMIEHLNGDNGHELPASYVEKAQALDLPWNRDVGESPGNR